MTIASFLFFTALVAVITVVATRGDDYSTQDGFFLAGRSLTWPFIAGSLLLTNLSTEQLVGLNGAAYTHGFAVMVWEVVAVLALVAMALFFLPRFLRNGVTTVPEYLELRFDRRTRLITNMIFLFAYTFILLPIILYTGATGLISMLDVQAWIGVESPATALWITVWAVGLVGSVYALFGGLRTVVVSDLLNGVGLLVGGLLIPWFGLSALGSGSVVAGLDALWAGNLGRFNAVGAPDSAVPFDTVFSGVLLLNLFYWTTNQQIIQRTFGASSLAEGQKGVIATGFLKLLGPLYLVIPGMIAFALFAGQGVAADQSYGQLVQAVLPAPLTGFFAAVMMGAILSSYNSALNSTCTLFSLGLYKGALRPDATAPQVLRASTVFGWTVTLSAMGIAPWLAGQASIFGYLQKMNGMYFIPIFAVVSVGMLTRHVPPIAATLALATGFGAIALGYFVPPFTLIVGALHEFHFLGVVFAYLVVGMLVIGELHPLADAWEPPDHAPVDMTPWPWAGRLGLGLVGLVVAIYLGFGDLSILG